MQIYIPSRSRFDNKSLTIERIAGGWKGKHEVFLVVPSSQRKSYLAMPERDGIPVLGCPKDGIARTREWIGHQADDKFLMLDDDLRFFYRPTVRPLNDPLPGAGQPNENPPRLYRAEPHHIVETLGLIEKVLDKYVHAAIGAREGNNTLRYPYALCKRPLRALAYRREAFLSCEHGRVAIMEDFDITLQLLKRGFQNYVTTNYAQDQYVTGFQNSKTNGGGCSDYRTHAVQEENVLKMVKLHAPFVVPKLKQNKHGGSFGTRTEATIYWQKAYQSSLKELGLL